MAIEKPTKDLKNTAGTQNLDQSSEQAIESIGQMIFGGGPVKNKDEDEEGAEGNPGEGEGEGEGEGGESGESGEAGEGEGEEGEGGEGEGEEGEGEGEGEIDFNALSEPLRDFLPEDQELNSQEDFQNALQSFSEQYKEELEANESIVSLFENHSEFAALARELSKDKDVGFKQALFRVIGEDEESQTVVPNKKKDPEGYAEYMLAKKEREREAQAEENKKKQNLSQSDKVVKKFRDQNDFGDEDVNNIMNKAHEMITNISQGKVTEEFLDIMAKGMNYEKAIEKNTQEAEKRGRNEGAKRRKKSDKGDGIPKPSSKGGSSRKSGKKQPGIVEASLKRAIDPTAW